MGRTSDPPLPRHLTLRAIAAGPHAAVSPTKRFVPGDLVTRTFDFSETSPEGTFRAFRTVTGTFRPAA
jgi:hypothetical protein